MPHHRPESWRGGLHNIPLRLSRGTQKVSDHAGKAEQQAASNLQIAPEISLTVIRNAFFRQFFEVGRYAALA